MRQGQRRGLDHTPLFRYLLSRIGEDWDEVFTEVAARLDSVEPVFWVLARQPHERQDYVRIGESTYYSGLYVDADNRLQVVDPELGPHNMEPLCSCCTHTFNRIRFARKYRPH